MSKVIVITGAGDGLGRAIARRFHKDGDKVVLLGRTLSKVQAVADELGEGALAVHCDVTDPAMVGAAFEEIGKSHDKIDVLINNAAIYEPYELHEARDDQITSALMSNVAGPVFVAREGLKLMDKGSHLINVTSEGVEIDIPMLWMYGGTKAALERIAEGLAKEHKPQGIRVTTVRAGKMYDETKTGSGWDPEVAKRFAVKCGEAGMPLMEQPLSHFNSVTDAFRAVVDMPADVNVGLVTLGGRRA